MNSNDAKTINGMPIETPPGMIEPRATDEEFYAATFGVSRDAWRMRFAGLRAREAGQQVYDEIL